MQRVEAIIFMFGLLFSASKVGFNVHAGGSNTPTHALPFRHHKEFNALNQL
jgi:hypothetical protein